VLLLLTVDALLSTLKHNLSTTKYVADKKVVLVKIKLWITLLVGIVESCHLVVIWRGEMATGEMAKIQVFWGVGC
jgi:hypothetical protein